MTQYYYAASEMDTNIVHAHTLDSILDVLLDWFAEYVVYCFRMLLFVHFHFSFSHSQPNNLSINVNYLFTSISNFSVKMPEFSPFYCNARTGYCCQRKRKSFIYLFFFLQKKREINSSDGNFLSVEQMSGIVEQENEGKKIMMTMLFIGRAIRIYEMYPVEWALKKEAVKNHWTIYIRVGYNLVLTFFLLNIPWKSSMFDARKNSISNILYEILMMSKTRFISLVVFFLQPWRDKNSIWTLFPYFGYFWWRSVHIGCFTGSCEFIFLSFV